MNTFSSHSRLTQEGPWNNIYEKSSISNEFLIFTHAHLLFVPIVPISFQFGSDLDCEHARALFVLICSNCSNFKGKIDSGCAQNIRC